MSAAAEKAARPRKTTAHDEKQLRAALGFTVTQLEVATAAGLIPPQDMKTPRWSGATVDRLVAQREEIAQQLPDVLSAADLKAAMGLPEVYGNWRRFERGREAGLIPAPDCAGKYWSRAVADDLVARAEKIRESIPPAPLGASKCAHMLSELTGQDVRYEDIAALAAAGVTRVVGDFEGASLYDVAALKLIASDPDKRAVLDGLLQARAEKIQAWREASFDEGQAAAHLGWRLREFEKVAKDRKLPTGLFNRYAREVIDELAADEDFVEHIRVSAELGPDEAAQFLEIRRTDFDYVTAAGWVEPCRYGSSQVGKELWIEFPFYRVGDLEQVLEIPWVDWEEVRAVKPGQVSPLREWTGKAITRADAIRAFCAQLRAEHSVEVWPRYDRYRGGWKLDWELDETGHPTRQVVAEALRAHPGAGQYADDIELSTKVGETIRWARAMLRKDTSVVIELKTVGLENPVVVEVALLDSYSGEILVHTLVDPAGAPMSSGARSLHGISDEQLAAQGRPWAEVLPQLLAAVGDRFVLAYNADFDRKAMAASTRHAGLDITALPPAGQWGCLMEARSTWLAVEYWLPLGGRGRALPDARDELELLHRIVSPPSSSL